FQHHFHFHCGVSPGIQHFPGYHIVDHRHALFSSLRFSEDGWVDLPHYSCIRERPVISSGWGRPNSVRSVGDTSAKIPPSLKDTVSSVTMHGTGKVVWEVTGSPCSLITMSAFP